MTTDSELPIEERIAQMLAHLGLEKAHFAAREFQEFDGLARVHPEMIASLTLVFPPRTLKADSLQPLGSRLLCFYGGKGPNASFVRRSLATLHSATQLEFKDYLDVNWSDVIVDHSDAIGDSMVDFVERMERDLNLPAANLSPGEGEAAGISYRIFGTGKPLVLLPLVLAPSQWEPLLSRLSKHYCTVVLGGAELGGVRQLEARGRTDGYRRALQRFVNEVGINPNDKILEVGCGSGVLTRLIAELTQRANSIVALDVNRYFLSEASALAQKLGYGDIIDFREGNTASLPLADNACDVTVSATVMEEVDADRMLAEMIRVTKPAGRIAVMIRAEDMMSFINLPLRVELKTKVETPRGNVSAGGCADASLYRRFFQAGLTSLKFFPQLASFPANGPHGERLVAGTVAALSAEEADEWHATLQSPEARELLFIARPFHCAVGIKPAKLP